MSWIIIYYVSPLQRWRHIGSPVTAQPVCVSVSVPFIRSSYSAGGQTRNVDTMLVLCWSTVYDANPTLAQYLSQRGGGGDTDGGPVSLSPPTESTGQCWMVDAQSRRWWTSVKPSLGWRVVFAGHCVVDQLAADTGPLRAIQQTRGIHTMLFQCWPTVYGAGPTLKQLWVNEPFLLGY